MAIYNFAEKHLKTEKMEIQINYKGIDLVVSGDYDKGEETVYYDSNGEGYPGVEPYFDIDKIYVLDSSVDILDLLYDDLDCIVDLVIEKLSF